MTQSWHRRPIDATKGWDGMGWDGMGWEGMGRGREREGKGKDGEGKGWGRDGEGMGWDGMVPPPSPVILVLQELELLLDAVQGLGVRQLEGLWGGGA